MAKCSYPKSAFKGFERNTFAREPFQNKYRSAWKSAKFQMPEFTPPDGYVSSLTFCPVTRLRTLKIVTDKLLKGLGLQGMSLVDGLDKAHDCCILRSGCPRRGPASGG